MSKLKISMLCAMALLLGQILSAQSWQFVGPRAMGMGGAGVATAYGPDAQYWNPAGLTQDEDLNETGLLINAGVSLEASKNILEVIHSLSDMSDKYKALQNDINSNNVVTASDISTIFAGLNDISKLVSNKTGALVNADVGLGFKYKNFSVSSRALGNAAVRPVIDTANIQFNTGGSGLSIGTNVSNPGTAYSAAASTIQNVIDTYGLLPAIQSLIGDTTATNSTELAYQIINAVNSYGGVTVAEIEDMANTVAANASGASEILNQYATATGSYEDNETLAMADVAAFGEVSLGYGNRVFPGVKIGGNIKVISGYTAETGIMVLKDNEKFADILDKANKNKQNTNNWAIDLGALVNFSELFGKDIFWNPQIGLTARNINGPKFDRPAAPAGTDPAVIAQWNSNKYQLKPQVRAGVSANPFKWMTLAADIDLTENDTLLDSIKSRQLALGMEINIVNSQKFNMPLRIGYNKNLAESSLAPFYTAGIGFDMLHFFIELAAAVSTETTELDGNKIPSSAAASLTFGFLF